MGVYIVPSYIKPRSKILTWMVPMCFVEEQEQEFISDLKVGIPFIKEEIRYYINYKFLTMKKDMTGNPESYKVWIDPKTLSLRNIESFVRDVTGGKELLRIKGNFDLLGLSGEDFIRKIYENLDTDQRINMSPPTQWLIYFPNKKILTRLCWVINLKGEITVKPYGQSNLLLEVEELKFDKINQFSIKTIKKHSLLREKLNNLWRTLVTTEELEELKEEIEIEESKETEEEKESQEEKEIVGKVI